MIELYTHPMSPCSQKVRIVLAEKHIEWEGRFVDLPGKENLQPWYLELNPLGVPGRRRQARHRVIDHL
jgi:glutathione S-transferase